MRIAIIQGAFLPVPPMLGGAVEKVWHLLGQEMARMGHEVVHISKQLDGLAIEEVSHQVRHIRIPGYDTPKSGLWLKALDFRYSWRVNKVIRQQPFDVVVSNTFWAPILLPSAARRVCVVDVQRMPKGQFKFYKTAARFRANSTPVDAALKQELAPSEHHRVVTIPNPLPFRLTEPIDFARKRPVILYTGRIHPEKGLDLLIDAYRLTNRSCRLVLVGPWDIAAGGGGNEYVQLLQTQAQGLPVDFVGPIYDTEQLNDYYRNAALFVYPSVAEQGETFGLAPLEAMAWGCVPVVSGLACFQDFITHGHNGFTFNHRQERTQAVADLARQLITLQVNPTLRQQVGERALAVRDSHSAQRIAQLFVAEFEQLTPL